jgi:hypothetical protein
MHDNRSAGFFPFRRLAMHIEAIHNLAAIPYLMGPEGKEFADPQTGTNTQDDDGSISQPMPTIQIFQRELQSFGREGRSTNHVFLLKPVERPFLRKFTPLGPIENS